jgi:hypothetical protein
MLTYLFVVYGREKIEFFYVKCIRKSKFYSLTSRIPAIDRVVQNDSVSEHGIVIVPTRCFAASLALTARNAVRYTGHS